MSQAAGSDASCVCTEACVLPALTGLLLSHACPSTDCPWTWRSVLNVAAAKRGRVSAGAKQALKRLSIGGR